MPRLSEDVKVLMFGPYSVARLEKPAPQSVTKEIERLNEVDENLFNVFGNGIIVVTAENNKTIKNVNYH